MNAQTALNLGKASRRIVNTRSAEQTLALRADWESRTRAFLAYVRRFFYGKKDQRWSVNAARPQLHELNQIAAAFVRDLQLTARQNVAAGRRASFIRAVRAAHAAMKHAEMEPVCHVADVALGRRGTRVNGCPVLIESDAPLYEWDELPPDAPLEEHAPAPVTLREARRVTARSVVVDDDGRILVLSPKDEPYITLPGGGVSCGELDDDAAERECEEETGYRMTVDRYLGDFDDEFARRRYFAGRKAGGTRTDTDMDGDRPVRVVWLSPPEALKALTSPYDRAAVALAINGRVESQREAFDPNQPRDEHGRWATVRGVGDDVDPMPPGTRATKEGYLRLYHYINSRDPAVHADDILSNEVAPKGILLSKARGESYGEPNVVWASGRIPERRKAFVEFQVPPDDPAILVGDAPAYRDKDGTVRVKWGDRHDQPWTQADADAWNKEEHNVGFRRDITPDEFIAVHQSWHDPSVRNIAAEPQGKRAQEIHKSWDKGVYESFKGDREYQRVYEWLLKRWGPPANPKREALREDGGAFLARCARDEHGWCQPEGGTDGPAFKQWFGDSKVVGDDGKPLLVFHGASTPTAHFAPSDATNIHTQYLGIPTFWFSTNEAQAQSYAEAGGAYGYGSVSGAYLRMERPVIIDGKGRDWDAVLEDVREAVVTYQTPEEKTFLDLKEKVFEKYADHRGRLDYDAMPDDERKTYHDAADVYMDHRHDHPELYGEDKPRIPHNCDGIIIKDVFDWPGSLPRREDLGPFSPYADEYVVFDQSQIRLVARRREALREDGGAFFSRCERDDGGRCLPEGGATDTPEFKQWFEGSTVTNADGSPKVLYHGSSEDMGDEIRPFTHFGTAQAANDRVKSTWEFSTEVVGRSGGTPNIMPVYLAIKNPLRMPDLAGIETNTGLPMTDEDGNPNQEMLDELREHWGEEEEAHNRGWEGEEAIAQTLLEMGEIDIDEFEDHRSNKAALELLAEKGYDGVVYQNVVEDPGHDSYIVFRPEQVKSAWNRGTFDPKSKKISEAEWVEEKHPRWPGGAPEGKGGEFAPSEFQVGVTSSQLTGDPEVAKILTAGQAQWKQGDRIGAMQTWQGITTRTRPELEELLDDGATHVRELDTHTFGLYFSDPEASYTLRVASDDLPATLASLGMFAQHHNQETMIVAHSSQRADATPRLSLDFGRALSTAEVLEVQRVLQGADDSPGLGLTINQRTGKAFSLNIQAWDGRTPEAFKDTAKAAVETLKKNGFRVRARLDRARVTIYHRDKQEGQTTYADLIDQGGARRRSVRESDGRVQRRVRRRLRAASRGRDDGGAHVVSQTLREDGGEFLSTCTRDEHGWCEAGTSGGALAGPRPEWIGKWKDISEEQRVAEIKKGEAWDQATLAQISLGQIDATHPNVESEYVKGTFSGEIQTAMGGDYEWATMPPIMYHVTTALDSVVKDGLKTRYELGQDEGKGLGGGSDKTVSFTDDPQAARFIAEAVIQRADLLSERISFEDLLAEAEHDGYRAMLERLTGPVGDKHLIEELRRGVVLEHRILLDEKKGAAQGLTLVTDGTPWGMDGPMFHLAADGVTKVGPMWTRPMTDDERVKYLAMFHQAYLAARQEAGKGENPLFFLADAAALAKVDPKQIGVVQVRPKPGAKGFRLSALGEWRTGTGKAVEITGVLRKRKDGPGFKFDDVPKREADSFFARCERDEHGWCLPEGGSPAPHEADPAEVALAKCEPVRARNWKSVRDDTPMDTEKPAVLATRIRDEEHLLFAGPQDQEWGVAFTETGDVTRLRGDTGSVSVSKAQREALANGIFTHLHPPLNGDTVLPTGLSGNDIEFAIHHNLAEIRSVAQGDDDTLVRHVVTRPAGGWPTEFRQAVAGVARDIFPRHTLRVMEARRRGGGDALTNAYRDMTEDFTVAMRGVCRRWNVPYRVETERIKEPAHPDEGTGNPYTFKGKGKLVIGEPKREAGWEEEEHPRGKTTEKSNAGSFAPAEASDDAPVADAEIHKAAQDLVRATVEARLGGSFSPPGTAMKLYRDYFAAHGITGAAFKAWSDAVMSWATGSDEVEGPLRAGIIKAFGGEMFRPGTLEVADEEMQKGYLATGNLDDVSPETLRKCITLEAEYQRESLLAFFADKEELRNKTVEFDDDGNPVAIYLWRGYVVQDPIVGQKLKQGDTVEYQPPAVASFSAQANFAGTFAAGWSTTSGRHPNVPPFSLEPEILPGETGVLVKVRVPWDRLIGTCVADWGSPSVAEMIALGDKAPFTAEVVHVIRGPNTFESPMAARDAIGALVTEMEERGEIRTGPGMRRPEPPPTPPPSPKPRARKATAPKKTGPRKKKAP